MTKPSLAIIGTGVAGMGCAYFLHDRFDLTVYEQNDYVGGHAHTVAIERDDETVVTDTAFIIFNKIHYPYFSRLLEELRVPSMRCPMSFSFQIAPLQLEYATVGLSYLPTEIKHFFNPRFVRMLKEMRRFYKEAVHIFEDERYRDHSIEEYLKEHGYSDEFIHYYLVPLVAVVWSTPPDQMIHFPAYALIRFLREHGAFQNVFEGLKSQRRWLTVVGGSGSYRDKIIQPFKHRIRTDCRVTRVRRTPEGVSVTDASGGSRTYDRVVLACHADQALNILADPAPREKALLGAFKYNPVKVTLHTDPSLMPRKRKTWKAWNYYIGEDTAHRLEWSFTYYMTAIQKVSKRRDYFITLNDLGRVHEKHLLGEYRYAHPSFDLEAMRAQERLPELNAAGPVYFCGSYFNYGFHEDAFRSSVELCRRITGEPIWGS